jgi:hypothetical protein
MRVDRATAQLRRNGGHVRTIAHRDEIAFGICEIRQRPF